MKYLATCLASVVLLSGWLSADSIDAPVMQNVPAVSGLPGGEQALVMGADGVVKASDEFSNQAYAFNVKKYGATGDGVTDDTDAIQATIDAAFAAGGGTVFLPEGTYRVTLTALTWVGEGSVGFNNPLKNAIMLRDGVHLMGAGREQTIIKPLDAAPNNLPILYGESGCADIIISNLWVDGNNARAAVVGAGSEDEGINFKTSTNCWVVDCKITDTGQDGIDFDGVGSNGGVIDTLIEDTWGSGVHCAGAGMFNMLFSRLVITGCSDERQAAEDPVDPENISCGLDMKGGYNNIVDSCHISGTARGLGLFGCVRTKISNCNIISTSATLPAIWIKGTTTSGNAENTFLNCYIASNVSSAAGSILIEFAARFTRIEGCLLGGKYAINVGGGNIVGSEQGGELHVSNTSFISSTYGIWIQDTDDFAGSGALRPVHVNNCAFTDTMQQGIRLACACKGSLTNSQFQMTSGGKVGIMFRAEADDDWLVANNSSFTGCQQINIQSGSAGVHTFQGNNFTAGDVYTKENASIWKDNTFYDIEFDTGSATANRLEGNNILNSVIITGATTAYGQTWIGNYGAGAYAESGTAVLVAGTVTVANPIVPAGATITLTVKTPGGTQGFLTTSTIVAGTSFDIDSTSGTDTSTIFWKIESQ